MKMEKNRELLKRTAAVIVSLAMALVMLGSMGMEVRAGETKEVTFKNVNQEEGKGVWQRLEKVSTGTEITFMGYDNKGGIKNCYLWTYYWLEDSDSDFDFGLYQYIDVGKFLQGSSIGSSIENRDYISDQITSKSQQTLTVENKNGYSLWDVNVAVMDNNGDEVFVVILTPAKEDAAPTSAGGAK